MDRGYIYQKAYENYVDFDARWGAPAPRPPASPWVPEFRWLPWIPLDLNGFPWKPAVPIYFPMISMDSMESTDLHGLPWKLKVSIYFIRISMDSVESRDFNGSPGKPAVSIYFQKISMDSMESKDFQGFHGNHRFLYIST